MNKYFPRFLFKSCDGGEGSGVTGYWLIEWKALFSIVLLHFNKGSREVYHTHAFNALTWWLSGNVTEEFYPSKKQKYFKPSFIPKITLKSCYHKIIANKNSWAISFRGPWEDIWKESRDSNEIYLIHSRKVIQQ